MLQGGRGVLPRKRVVEWGSDKLLEEGGERRTSRGAGTFTRYVGVDTPEVPSRASCFRWDSKEINTPSFCAITQKSRIFIFASG